MTSLFIFNTEQIINIGAALINLGGFALLYSTLKLQALTFQSQQEVTKLDNQRFLMSIRPQFKIEKCDFKQLQSLNDTYLFIVNLKAIENTVFNLNIRNKIAEQEHYYVNYYRTSVPKESDINLINKTFVGGMLPERIHCELFFVDEMKNQYTQQIFGTVWDLCILPPQLVG